MKGYIKLVLILGIISFGVTSLVPPPKCTGDEEYKEGVGKIGNYRVLKDYRVTMKKGADPSLPPSESYPISLTKGLKYKFLPVNNSENESNMIVRIFLDKATKTVVATTYNKSAKKHYPAMEFQCHISGTYYLDISFDKAKKGCGVCLFAVSK